MRQHPIHAYLTPDPGDVPLPSIMTELRVAVSRGLPAPLDIPGFGLTALLSVPTARIRGWMEAGAAEVAVASAPQRSPLPKGDRGDDVRATLSPVLILTEGRVPRALMPLIVNARTYLTRTGDQPGAAVELVIRGFQLTAEAMRGPAAGASFVELGWRRIEAGSDVFMAPVARPTVRQRLVATTGTRNERRRRPIAAEFDTSAGTDAEAQAVRGGINWRLTHE
jgi:hypothetical protein